MSIDWVSLAIVLGAYVATRYSKLSVRQGNGINAGAMFAVFAWRAASAGLGGTNGLITMGAAVLGVMYLVRAIRAP